MAHHNSARHTFHICVLLALLFMVTSMLVSAQPPPPPCECVEPEPVATFIDPPLSVCNALNETEYILFGGTCSVNPPIEYGRCVEFVDSCSSPCFCAYDTDGTIKQYDLFYPEGVAFSGSLHVSVMVTAAIDQPCSEDPVQVREISQKTATASVISCWMLDAAVSEEAV